jgi:hypothetical protein
VTPPRRGATPASAVVIGSDLSPSRFSSGVSRTSTHPPGVGAAHHPRWIALPPPQHLDAVVGKLQSTGATAMGSGEEPPMPADHHDCGIHTTRRSQSPSHRHHTSMPRPAQAHKGPYQALLPCATTEQNLDARHSLDLTPTAPPPRVLSAPPHAAMPPGTVAAAQAAGPHDEAPLDRERPRPHLRRRELGPVSSSDGGKGRGGRRPALWQRLGLDLLCRPSGGGTGGREGTSKYLKL